LKIRISVNIAKQETEAEITNKDWIYDSAASHHFCVDSSQFENLRPLRQMIELADGDIAMSEGIGTVTLRLKNSVLQLHNVIYAPALNINLLSGFQLRQKGFRVVIDKECTIGKGGKIFGELIPQNNLFFVDFVGITANVVRSKLKPTPRPKPLNLWHRRLGHLGFRAVKKLEDWAYGIKILNDPEDNEGLNNRPCEACIKGKQAKRPLKGRGNPYRHSNEPFDLVHTDICQPLIPGYDGSRYFVTFTDDYTRVTFVK
jgi:hypothetical protein